LEAGQLGQKCGRSVHHARQLARPSRSKRPRSQRRLGNAPFFFWFLASPFVSAPPVSDRRAVCVHVCVWAAGSTAPSRRGRWRHGLGEAPGAKRHQRAHKRPRKPAGLLSARARAARPQLIAAPAQCGETALHLAARGGHADLIKELVRMDMHPSSTTRVREALACRAASITVASGLPVAVRRHPFAPGPEGRALTRGSRAAGAQGRFERGGQCTLCSLAPRRTDVATARARGAEQDDAAADGGVRRICGTGHGARAHEGRCERPKRCKTRAVSQFVLRLRCVTHLCASATRRRCTAPYGPQMPPPSAPWALWDCTRQMST
jgi:hypothetical protein